MVSESPLDAVSFGCVTIFRSPTVGYTAAFAIDKIVSDAALAAIRTVPWLLGGTWTHGTLWHYSIHHTNGQVTLGERTYDLLVETDVVALSQVLHALVAPHVTTRW